MIGEVIQRLRHAGLTAEAHCHLKLNFFLSSHVQVLPMLRYLADLIFENLDSAIICIWLYFHGSPLTSNPVKLEF